MNRLLIIFSIFMVKTYSHQSNIIQSCQSPVYCQGKLLDTIQMARIFNDSKSFVDMRMKYSQADILRRFDDMMRKYHDDPTREQIAQFVADNFADGNEIEDWNPKDYNSQPGFLRKINDLVVRDFARNLVHLWPVLARKVRPEVREHEERYSMIPVPNGFIVPGGRFREFYYWDSYWIVQGLLISEMHETARGVIDNFIYMVNKYGFVPNGGRVYYLNRSQPPLLTLMAASYLRHTQDLDWLKKNVKSLDKELRYWLDNKVISVKREGVEYTLARYQVKSATPRPESYAQDVTTASYFENEEDRLRCYAELKSGAETGWDFSTRWIFGPNGTQSANLSHIQASRVIPVDLNAFLCRDFMELSRFYKILGDRKNAEFWNEKYKYWQKAVEQVLWDERDGIWYDYDIIEQEPRRLFFPSNIAPLWAGIVDEDDLEKFSKRVLAYLKEKEVLEFPGGVPTSLIRSGEQWDYPNAWPPLQAFIIQGLDRSGLKEGRTAAEFLAKKWLKANIRGFMDTHEMFEKYDAMESGKFGGGGEYQVQSGFGWTNGVALELIVRYYTNNSAGRKQHDKHKH